MRKIALTLTLRLRLFPWLHLGNRSKLHYARFAQVLTLSLSLTLTGFAQVPLQHSTVDYDVEKYPDYNPDFNNPDPVMLRIGNLVKEKRAERERIAQQNPALRKSIPYKTAQEELGLPDHWDNASTKHFPPVFSQSGGSCGSASRIGYMFTHELNSFRDLDGSLMENRYPTHFVWLLTYGNSGKDAFVEYVGVPSAKTYGGITTSSLFGYQDTQNDFFGWMTGYEKWYEGFFNRMYTPTSNPYSLGTEEGRIATKAWLYNHCGDTDFHSGGLVGLGVASGGWWYDIPKTALNDSLGVTGMKYVGAWGTSVDHAITLVGYDDRIEFDLDGNGVFGETSKDEKGAWIIVNSWGNWCNKGFIYCPYAYAGPTFKEQGSTRVFSGGFWTGELYKVRKNYRPLRTIKLRMQYSRRSELYLQCGISSDITATKPQKTIDMHHFKYAGDGNGGNTNPAPEVPMLGKWADGVYHTEPMEFGYDLTDMSAGYDKNKSLKYFFIVNTKSWAAGEGKILGASIIDYERDPEGIETPFNLGEDAAVSIQNAGKQTIISVVVYGAAYNKPNALSCYEGVLSWEEPDKSSHVIDHYNVYCDGKLLTATKERTYAYEPATTPQTFSVTCVYDDATESAATTASTPVASQPTNLVCTFEKNGFTVPDVFDNHYDQCTIEFMMRPTAFADWNNEVGPGWGTWMQHFAADGTYNVGWNNNNRITSSSKFTKGAWVHIAIVINKNRLTLYKNAVSVGTLTSADYSGLGGFGDLVFSSSDHSNWYQQAQYDEIRIWDKARTVAELKGSYATAVKKIEYYGTTLPDGLLAYYKGDTFQDTDGCWYMRDCVGGHHALIHTGNVQESSTETTYYTTRAAAALAVTEPTETIYVGTPVTFYATRSDAINDIWWNIPSVGVNDKHVTAPRVTFTTAGTHQVVVAGTDYAGAQHTDTVTVSVTVNGNPLDATFKTTATEVAAGERISFIPNTYEENCSYVWHFEGADEEEARSVTAAARYSTTGTFAATLTVTAPDGRSATSTTPITVTAVAPVAGFIVDKTVLTTEDAVTLTSTSKYEPTTYEWILSCKQGVTVVKDAQKTFTFHPTLSGKYDVTLKASNDVGTGTTMTTNAFVVANADSKTGLTFATNGNQQVVFDHQPIPASEAACAYSIDMWLNPNTFKPTIGTDSCRILGIGDDASTFLLTTNEKGVMTVSIDGVAGHSPEGYVIEGAWHNYVITHSTTGRVTFFRDGAQIGFAANMPKTMPTCKSFRLGADGAQMNGSIDELRFWQYALTVTHQKNVINQPLQNPETYVSGTYKLLAYYDFNQNSGDVLDRTSGVNNGKRLNFGPEGDAWTPSDGVFTLDFSTNAEKDVSSKYLTNYKRAFSHYTTTVNNSTANRFYKIKNWTLENTTTENNVTAGAHVDNQKYNDFTVTTGWDNFPTLADHKAYQTVELEPGFYTLTCSFGMHGAAGDSYLVAAAGTGLPSKTDLKDALGYCALEDAKCTFMLTEKTQTSMGVLVNSMTGQNIFCIQNFKLTCKPVEVITGIDVLDGEGGNEQEAPYIRGIFDMQGRKLERITQPGCYIINGKKVMKR